MTKPRGEVATAEGITIKGCSFKFHQDLTGFASILVMDINKSLIREVKSDLKKISTEDTYEISSLRLTTYKESGNYFQCKLNDTVSMADAALSDTSDVVQIEGKSNKISVLNSRLLNDICTCVFSR